MTDLLTKRENASISKFVEQAGSEGYLRGRVLDYGCGKQPYRSLVQSFGAEYVGYDRDGFPANQSGNVGDDRDVGRFDWNAILCTQVVQYVPHVSLLLRGFYTDLSQERGHLVMTYPTNWPEVQDVDLWRFTKAGMERRLRDAGFTIVMHERREVTSVMIDPGYTMALGYGVVARA